MPFSTLFIHNHQTEIYKYENQHLDECEQSWQQTRLGLDHKGTIHICSTKNIYLDISVLVIYQTTVYIINLVNLQRHAGLICMGAV